MYFNLIHFEKTINLKLYGSIRLEIEYILLIILVKPC